MEIRLTIKLVILWKTIILLGIIVLLSACFHSEKEAVPSIGIVPDEHMLLAITPDFSIKMAGDALNKHYLRLKSGKLFPVIGILRIDGRTYRFMGGDSLRISPIAPLANDSVGWSGKYSYLFPGKGWEQKEYDDSFWKAGNGAFGPVKGNSNIRTAWGAENIYVRRHIKIDNKDTLEGHKIYVCYICDDQIKLFWNGDFFSEKGITYQTQCERLTDEAIAHICNGTNVLAAYGRNTGGPALLDFGLYIENKTYSEADTVLLKQIDIQATQTHYVFQCGDVELQIDFVSPSLSEMWNMTGWPVGFLSYQVRAEDKKEHTVEILFDVDMEWMFGKRKIDSWVEQEWRFVKSDSLYLGMTADETTFSCDDSHVVLFQKLCAENGNKGILLIGCGEGQRIQYVGERLQPLWNSNRTGEVKELMMAVGNKYQKLREECDKLDKLWNNKAFQVSDKTFAEQILPSYRNFISSHRFVLSSDHKSFCFGDTLGNVREIYKNFPVLLFFNRVDWMKSLLNPIFEYCEDERWKRKYPPYDIGLYPVASKQVKTDNCAEEAAANMLMMMLAIVEAEQNFSYAELHWEHLCLWANYLKERMAENASPSIELLDGNDEHVKCVLGLMAYRKLIQLKDAYE